MKEGEDLTAIFVDVKSGRIHGYVPLQIFTESWGISKEGIYSWRRKGYLPEAIKVGRDWFLPEGTRKPEVRQGRPRKEI